MPLAQSNYFTDGDIVALQGDFVSDMYFVHEGKLELRVSRDRVESGLV